MARLPAKSSEAKPKFGSPAWDAKYGIKRKGAAPAKGEAEAEPPVPRKRMTSRQRREAQTAARKK